MLSDGRSKSALAFTKSFTISKLPFCMALQIGVRNVLGSNIFGSAFILFSNKKYSISSNSSSSIKICIKDLWNGTNGSVYARSIWFGSKLGTI